MLLATLAMPALGQAADDGLEEALVVFVRATESEVSRAFAETHLPALRDVAAQLDLPLRRVDLDASDAAAPAGVHLTPLIVYHGARGQAIFQGRYADPGKVAHFVRTSRAVPVPSEPETRRGELVWRSGRAAIAGPLKLTDLAGTTPADFDADAFARAALAGLDAGMRDFGVVDEVVLGPSDRRFYLDVHPHRSENGTLSLSVALFSQFDCVDALFTNFGDPIQGPWAERDALFARAGALLEDAVRAEVAGSAIGDGFDPVPTAVAKNGWADLGLVQPSAADAAALAAAAAITLPARWAMPPAPADPANAAPQLVFRFPPPIERYTGEVRTVDAALDLGPDGALDGARGWVEAGTASVTMGEEALDNAIHATMILVDRHPSSRFTLEQLRPARADDTQLRFGRATPVVAEGTFELMGQAVPMTVRGELEPVIDADGAPRLRIAVTARFNLETPFGIKGPDGPKDARETLVLHFNTLLQAADAASG
ncbi:MAG: hypothetical protein AAF772_13885 [Acidobacteriota bacterium]